MGGGDGYTVEFCWSLWRRWVQGFPLSEYTIDLIIEQNVRAARFYIFLESLDSKLDLFTEGDKSTTTMGATTHCRVRFCSVSQVSPLITNIVCNNSYSDDRRSTTYLAEFSGGCHVFEIVLRRAIIDLDNIMYHVQISFVFLIVLGVELFFPVSILPS